MLLNIAYLWTLGRDGGVPRGASFALRYRQKKTDAGRGRDTELSPPAEGRRIPFARPPRRARTLQLAIARRSLRRLDEPDFRGFHYPRDTRSTNNPSPNI